MPRKSAEAKPEKIYRSISEVSELLEVKPHVLRYWETQFPSLRPRKNRAGNRMYQADEIQLLARIKELLYERRFTIEGARRRIAEERRDGDAKTSPAGETTNAAARDLVVAEVREELRRLAERLRREVDAPTGSAAARSS